jgi:hypothetical protein
LKGGSGPAPRGNAWKLFRPARGTVAVISEQCHRTRGHRKLGLERGQQFRERVKDLEPRSRGMNGLSTILCLLEVRVIPHTFMLPRHSLSDHVVEALCLHILQLIKTAGNPPGEEKRTLPLSPGKRLLLKGLGDLSLACFEGQ